MRARDKGFRSLRHLLIPAAVAAAALAAATTDANAEGIAGGGGFRSMSVGPRATIHTPPSFRNLEPRFQRFDNTNNDDYDKTKKRTVRGAKTGAGGEANADPGAGRRPQLPPGAFRGPPGPRGGINVPPAGERRYVTDHVVLEFAGNFPAPGIAQLLARHRLAQIDVQYFTLTDTTYVLARILDRSLVPNKLGGLGNEGTLRFAQPNYLFRGTQAQGGGAMPGAGATFQPPADANPPVTPAMGAVGARPSAGDPAQYALAKLRLNEAHGIANGDKVLVAVIDSGIDTSHPELQGVIAGTFDALGKAEQPHSHGTAIAGAIAAHARLMGAAPAARILAIRAFGASGESAEATTFAILKSLEYAASQNARVINMSFAGPADPAMSRHLAAARAKGAVLVAASGNFGPKSPPQYPAADPNVIAVSATDADDKLFKASNIGRHIAVAAPGVDILLPAPNSEYQLISGTSFSAAYVSGVAALVIQRAPGLTPDAVRNILISTAKDLGPRGRDDQFGAGLVDAYQAIMAVSSNAAGGPRPAPRPVSAR